MSVMFFDFPAAVCSSVRTKDVYYGEIIIKDKKTRSKMRGKAALLCIMSTVMERVEKQEFSGIIRKKYKKYIYKKI